MAILTRRHFLKRSAGALLAARAGAQGGFLPCEALTSGPRHHFFGYYDTCPWDATGRYLLAHEVDFAGRQPKPGEEVVLGCVDLAAGKSFRPFARTSAWCWQLGSLLRWLPDAPERKAIYNVRRGDSWASEVADVRLGTKRCIPSPIFSLNHDGSTALSLNFSRLAWTRPGYGFEGVQDRGRHVPAPEDDGVYAVELPGGASRLIVSLAALSRHRPKPEFGESYHWVNHLLFNQDGSRFVFLHRWSQPGRGWGTRLYTADPSGGSLRLLLDHGLVSHFIWRDPQTILVWARHPSRGDRFYLVGDRKGEVEVEAVGEDVLAHDGHATFSPDRRWILFDGYPDRRNMRTLALWRVADGRRIDIGRFFSPPELSGPLRCDLHPRWSRDGLQVCVDSVHEGKRQIYAIDVASLVA